MRVDKYLWCVRIFKTRSLATKECKNSNVEVNGQRVKPSRELQEGDKLRVKKNFIHYELEVKAFPKSRVGAKLVPDYMINNTKPEEFEKLKKIRAQIAPKRDPGAGRPTKKERRDIENIISFSIDKDFDWDSFLEDLEKE